MTDALSVERAIDWLEEFADDYGEGTKVCFNYGGALASAQAIRYDSDRDVLIIDQTNHLLSDERGMVEERRDSIEGSDSHLTSEEVAEDLGLDE